MYEHLVYDDFKFATIAQVEPKLYPRTLTLNGMSKAYCMTGWRLGYAAGPVELIKAMGALQSQSTTNPSSISQAAGVEALNGPQDFIPKNNAVFKTRRDLVVGDAERGGGHALPGAGRRVLCLSVLCRRDRQEDAGRQDDRHRHGVLRIPARDRWASRCVPGTAFGLAPHFRISYAASNETLTEACTRIQKACAALA